MLFSLIQRTLVVGMSVTLVACASGPKSPEQEEVTIPRQYVRAYVADISVNLQDPAPDSTRLEDKKKLEFKLPAAVREVLTENNMKIEAQDPGQGVDLVRLKLNVTYDPGNRHLRYLAGFAGAGKATVTVRVDALDGVSGAIVVTKTLDEDMRMGLFGGNFYSTIEETVADATDDVLEDLAEIPQRAR